MTTRQATLVGAIAGMLLGMLGSGWAIWQMGSDDKARVALEAKKRTLIAELDRKAKNVTPTGGKQTTAEPTGAPHFSAEDKAMQNAELRRLHRNNWKAQIRLEYAALFRSLHLTPEQIDRIATIWADGRMANDDYAAAHVSALKTGNTPEAKAVQDEMQAIRDASDQALQTALGSANYEQFQQYQKEWPTRSLTDQMVNAAAAAGSPIDPAQAENLNRIIVAAASTASGQISVNHLDWDSTWAQVQPLLTPAQQDVMKTIWVDRGLWIKIMRIQRASVK